MAGGTVTLDGPGVYIFRSASDLTTSGSFDLINGARECDVYWRVQTLANINGTEFIGTILAGTGIHFDTADIIMSGRALAIGGDVTLLNTTIQEPDCTVAPLPPQVIVNKVVINDNNGDSVIADFPLFLDGVPVVSGVSTVTIPGLHTITETSLPGYSTTFGGHCSDIGTLTIANDEIMTCTITNNDIPPGGGGGGGGGGSSPTPTFLNVVKVPSPLALPGGPGTVNYTYTLTNLGTAPISNITMLGDTCSPIVLSSGDINGNSLLESSETWVYTCSTTLTETHTNVVTATGTANGITATDIATATVVVGLPVTPPLINVTKVPTPSVLPATGGMVTYNYRVTNPGIIPLSNVQIGDDRCSPVTFVSGDANGNSLLESTETWSYTCTTSLSETTVNTVFASGQANGITARDFAIATVIVPETTVPGLPNTGIGSSKNIALLALIPLFFFAFRRKKKS